MEQEFICTMTRKEDCNFRAKSYESKEGCCKLKAQAPMANCSMAVIAMVPIKTEEKEAE